MKSAASNDRARAKNRNTSRAILSVTVVLVSSSILAAGLVLIYFQAFVWDSEENIDFALWLLNRPYVNVILLIVVLGLYGVTVVDLVKTNGWSKRTCFFAVCIWVFSVYAITYYWSRQLWLAKNGRSPDGLTLQFSLRNLLVAFTILAVTTFVLVTLYHAWIAGN